MSGIARTELMARELVFAVIPQKDVSRLMKLTTADIVVSVAVNKEDPVVTRGQRNYLLLIEKIWDELKRCSQEKARFENFTEESGTLFYDRLFWIQKPGKPNPTPMISTSRQVFTFANGSIKNIYITETLVAVTPEEANGLDLGGLSLENMNVY